MWLKEQQRGPVLVSGGDEIGLKWRNGVGQAHGYPGEVDRGQKNETYNRTNDQIQNKSKCQGELCWVSKIPTI